MFVNFGSSSQFNYIMVEKLYLFILITSFGLTQNPTISDTTLSPDFGAGARYPNMAVMNNGNLIVSWLEPGGKDTFHVKISQYDGSSWNNPKTIISADNLFVNWADFPSVFHLGGNKLAAHWLQYAGSGVYEYDVHMKLSEDMGNTWSNDLIPHSDRTLSEHGFVSFFEFPTGSHGLVWLDGRNMAVDDDFDNIGKMALYTTSISPEFSFGEDYPLDEMVCECCPTSALTFNDRVFIAYRNRETSELRNIHLLKYENGTWQDMEAIHNDGWKISGCPVNGPTLAANRDGIGIAWFTAPNGETQVNFIMTKDLGNSFTKPMKLNDKEALGRVDITTFDNNFLVSWIEIDDQKCNLVMREITQMGKLSNKYFVDEIPCDRSSGNPKIEVYEKMLFVTWTITESGIESRWLELESLFR